MTTTTLIPLARAATSFMRRAVTTFIVAGLALVAAPTASAAHGQDDTISRTFPYISAGRLDFDPHGIGWYDAASTPNVCIATLLGLQAPLGGNAYYENFRIWSNLPGWAGAVTFGTSRTIPLPCPVFINSQCTALSACGIQIRPTTVGPNVRTVAIQSGMVCNQASAFIDCIVTDSYWDVAHCPWDDAIFIGRDPANGKDENKGILGGPPFINHLVLSKDIDCRAYDNAYDVSYLLGSGLDGVTVSLVVPYGNGVDDTGFFVSCLGTTYTEIDHSTSNPTITPGNFADGVDWFQVLDLDALFLDDLSNWIDDITVQFGAGATGQFLAGLYDLGGKNDCDFAGGTPPSCHNGIHNDADGKLDENDNDCYDLDPNLGVAYYNPSNNE